MSETVQTEKEGLSRSKSLWNREFVFLFAVVFLAYANISVFFQFYEYLRTLPIDPRWYGLLISLFSAVSLAVRPVVSPFFHAGNARRYLYAGAGMLVVTLVLYSAAGELWSLFLVRALHGLAFVLLGTALMSVIVDYIPKERSAQLFGFLAILTLIPNTLIPPLLPFLTRRLGGLPGVLLLFAGITLVIFPLILGVPRARTGTESSLSQGRLKGREVLDDVLDPNILVTLVAMLLLYIGHALVFFFLDGYGRSVWIRDTGFFLTLSTLGEIGVRLAAGPLFDRVKKARLAGWSLIGITLGYGALGFVSDRTLFFSLGVILGLGWGTAMPVMNGLMFDLSLPKFRAFNINLGLQMFQGGFFLGPIIGGPVVIHWGFPVLFQICAAFGFLCAGLLFHLERKMHPAVA